MKTTTCCFTGHRPQRLPFGYNESDERCVKLKERLAEEIVNMIEKNGVTDFITGMAIGVDMYAAEKVIELKKKYPYIRLEAAIPCENQEARWSAPLRERYRRIISQCDTVSVLQRNYTNGCMQKRNVYMVEKSAFVIAVWDGSPSGTGNTVRYAQTRASVTVINPELL